VLESTISIREENTAKSHWCYFSIFFLIFGLINLLFIIISPYVNWLDCYISYLVLSICLDVPFFFLQMNSFLWWSININLA
jgi:hypothetical protein